jgi:hypothetical protein
MRERQLNTFDAGPLGGGTPTIGYYGSISGSKSDRFLDPVNFDNLNNHGDTERAFLRLDLAPDTSDALRLSGLTGRTNRDVPNTFSQEATGTDNTVETNDWNANLGWQHILGRTRCSTPHSSPGTTGSPTSDPAGSAVITNSKRSSTTMVSSRRLDPGRNRP